MKLKNLEALIDGNGNVEVGRIGPIHCTAVAADDDQMLAALVRRPSESLLELLERLDAALQWAWKHEEAVDEINSPPPDLPQKLVSQRRASRPDAHKTIGPSRKRR